MQSETFVINPVYSTFTSGSYGVFAFYLIGVKVLIIIRC